MQTVEELSLVLVDPLYLDIKDGVQIYLLLRYLLQIGGEVELVLLLKDVE